MTYTRLVYFTIFIRLSDLNSPTTRAVSAIEDLPKVGDWREDQFLIEDEVEDLMLLVKSLYFLLDSC